MADIFGVPVSLTIKGKTAYQSVFGALLSLIVVLTLFSVLVYKLSKVWTLEDYISTYNVTPFKEISGQSMISVNL